LLWTASHRSLNGRTRCPPSPRRDNLQAPNIWRSEQQQESDRGDQRCGVGPEKNINTPLRIQQFSRMETVFSVRGPRSAFRLIVINYNMNQLSVTDGNTVAATVASRDAVAQREFLLGITALSI